MLQANHSVHGEDVDLFVGGRKGALELAFLTMLIPFLERVATDREYRGEYRLKIEWLSDTDVEQEVRRSKEPRK